MNNKKEEKSQTHKVRKEYTKPEIASHMYQERHAEPNKAVEMWKDAIYRETRSFSGEKLNCYFSDKAESLLKSCGLSPRKNMGIKRSVGGAT